MVNKKPINLSEETYKQLIQLASLKQLDNAIRVKSLGEIIDDLVELKKGLPYYASANRIVGGIKSHNSKAENKRTTTTTTKNKKTSKKKRTQ